MTFIDFKNAFDSIHRGKLMKILRAYGTPERIVQSISDVYDNTSAKVLTPDGETDTFPIIAGVLQGDTLAPTSSLSSSTTPYVVLSRGKRKNLGSQSPQGRADGSGQ